MADIAQQAPVEERPFTCAVCGKAFIKVTGLEMHGIRTRHNVDRRPGGAYIEDGAESEERAPCMCGCGDFPRGKKSRFIPGHDARYHAAQKKAAAAVESK